MGSVAITNAAKRQKILALQDCLQGVVDSGVLDEYDPPITHHFAPGLYARECFLVKGSVVVGKIHKHAHINTICQGRVRVSTEHDDEVEIYEAPMTFVSKPGTKRAVYALEDTIWVTYHPTDETDLAAIEEQVIAKDYEELEIHLCYEQKKRLESGL